MNLSKDLAMCVRFARFAQEHGIGPADLAEMIALARKAGSAATRECNTGASADKQRERFEAAATAQGFDTEWNGLYPSLKKGGRYIDFSF